MAHQTTTTFICDRCGADIQHDVHRATLHIARVFLRPGTLTEAWLHDLCGDCRKSLDEWLKEGKS